MYTYWQDYYKSVIIQVSRSSTYLKLIKYKFTYELTKQPGQVVYMTVLLDICFLEGPNYF